MSKQFPEVDQEAEMKEHLASGECLEVIKQNGKGRKTLKSEESSVEVQTPQDRHSTFDPQNNQEAGNGISL